MRKADWVIADSHSTMDDVERLVPALRGRVSVVYPGISPGLTTNVVDKVDVRNELGFKNSDRLLLSVGGNKFYKNSSSLAKAFALISAQTPNARWLAVGGVAEDARKILQRSGLSEHLHEFHGLTDGDLGSLYRAGDVLVFPSWYEGFGWPPLEAMSCGLPVVASNAGSLREVLADAALLVEPSDVKGIATSTLRLLRDTNLRERQIAAGLAHARQFTWERTARGMFEVYNAVLDGKGA
jgi:glycosyltransferase involved in cell wall biosynthesis